MSDEKNNKDYAGQDMKYGSKASRGTVTPPKGYEPTPVKPKVITGLEEEEEEEESYEDMEFERDVDGTVYLTFKNKEDLPVPVNVEHPPKPEPKMANIMANMFEGHEVRTAVKDDGTIWFVLKDVCEAIGIASHRDVASRLDSSQKDCVGQTDAIGRERETTIISEDGLYDALLTSNKPKARELLKWVTKEVLPSIRKTGGYQDVPQFNVPTNFADALLLAYTQTKQLEAATEELAIARPKIKRLETSLSEVKETLTEVLPKVTAFDDFLTMDTNYSFEETAKWLGLPVTELTEFLSKKKWIFRRSQGTTANWLGRQDKLNDGLLYHKGHTHRPKGHTKFYTHYQCRVTPKGVDAIRRLLMEAN